MKSDLPITRKKNGESTTIKHVAQLAGVSRSTAACAFSNPDIVAEKTRARILEAARRLNYQPNVLARGLAGGKTHTIAVIWPLGAVSSNFDLTRKLAFRLQEGGYMPYVCDMPETYSGAKQLVEDFARRGADGLIVSPGKTGAVIEALQGDLRGYFRAVVLDSDIPRNIVGCDEVVRDRTGAFRGAAAHFARSGRRCPLLVMSGPFESQIKINAFVEEWHRSSEQVSDVVVEVLSNTSREKAPVAVDLLFPRFIQDGEFLYDAVMCENDMIAVAVWSWLRRQGLRVPEDVALIGFNNSEIAPLLDPPLASVDRCNDTTIDAILEILFARLKDPDLPPQRCELAMRFLWRESAGGVPPEGSVV